MGKSEETKSDQPIDLEREAEEARSELTGNILPFWLDHAMDGEFGGIMTGVDRSGTLIESDKSMWFQGRFAYVLARTYCDVSSDIRYLDAARSCLDFQNRFGSDGRGRMWYRVTREGAPLRMRRYLFTECFACAANAQMFAATGERTYLQRALDILELILRYRDTPGLLLPKGVPATRPSRGFALPMILLNVAQVLRRASAGRSADGEGETHGPVAAASGAGNETRERSRMLADRVAEESINLISTYFVNEEYRCVLEECGPNGELLDHFEGRTLNPGHAIEGAWFVLEEAISRGGSLRDADPKLVSLGVRMLDWMWEWGWDREYGGLYYFRDVLGHPSPEYWHDMKFWWPHSEAIIACLTAWLLTGDSRHAARYRQVKEWSYAHFPDDRHGEWYGYLHRDGTVSSDLKGNLFKGPFHIPRMCLVRAGASGRSGRPGRAG